MKRKIIYILITTLIVVYVCTQQTNYINSLAILALYTTGIIIYTKRKPKFDNISNQNNKIIATITHDLKTPAIAHIRAIELLLKGSFGEINENQRTFSRTTETWAYAFKFWKFIDILVVKHI